MYGRLTGAFWKWFKAKPLTDCFPCQYIDYEFRDLETDKWVKIYRTIFN